MKERETSGCDIAWAWRRGQKRDRMREFIQRRHGLKEGFAVSTKVQANSQELTKKKSSSCRFRRREMQSVDQ
jgi:hypothetical protein